jgi:hypothetical protein
LVLVFTPPTGDENLGRMVKSFSPLTGIHWIGTVTRSRSKHSCPPITTGFSPLTGIHWIGTASSLLTTTDTNAKSNKVSVP